MIYNKTDKFRKRYPHNKFWLTYSSSLREKPVNLVMTRDTLSSLKSTKQIIISRDKIKKV